MHYLFGFFSRSYDALYTKCYSGWMTTHNSKVASKLFCWNLYIRTCTCPHYALMHTEQRIFTYMRMRNAYDTKKIEVLTSVNIMQEGTCTQKREDMNLQVLTFIEAKLTVLTVLSFWVTRYKAASFLYGTIPKIEDDRRGSNLFEFVPSCQAICILNLWFNKIKKNVEK